MRLPFKALDAQLARYFPGSFLVFGEEPIQQNEAIDAIRTLARKQTFSREVVDITSALDWDKLTNQLSASNLFSQKRFVECRLADNVFSKIEKSITALAKTPLPADLALLISCHKIDYKIQKTNWFKQIEQKFCVIGVSPLSREETLSWIQMKLKQAGFKVNAGTAELLLERTEGNLAATFQAIERLKLSHPDTTLSAETILSTVSMDTRFSVFLLIDALLTGSSDRVHHILRGLKNEKLDPILVLWAITKESRILLTLCTKLKQGIPQSQAFTQCGIWRRKEPLVQKCIQRVTFHTLHSILLQAKKTDDIIKGRIPGDPWRSLSTMCLTLTGRPT